jgi:two-component system CheB/CheR fusion protein
LGASAGGIKALQSFFDHMAPDSGMAFVVVMHLAPDFESNLAQILQHHTTMPVSQVSQAIQVTRNTVYVIPPNKHLTMRDSLLDLMDPQQPAGRRVAVDLFFRTLSVAYGPRAVAVLLSGSDSDGVIGIKHIKEQGGLTVAQDPDEAEFDGMPRGAIDTGMVDWVLPVAEIPGRLLDFLSNEVRIHVPPEEAPLDEVDVGDGDACGPLTVSQTPSASDEKALLEVLRYLRVHTGHDFARYKRATVLRRVARRLQVNLIEDIAGYLEFIRTHPSEINGLLHDLLISVTNFFRDREAFSVLGAHIPHIFAAKQPGDQVRVWVPGCATGEEAYSVAILLFEHACRLDSPAGIQVFATDLDEDAIQIARAGVYPSTIEADVSPERLRRFFQRDQGRFKIRKEIRELVLFSAHDVLKDPPFSRLDLVTCRNLLIYLKIEAQQALFDIFHFALHPGGLLLLGGSENLSDSHALFAPLDKRARLFVQRAGQRSAAQHPTLPFSSRPSSLRNLMRANLPGSDVQAAHPPGARATAGPPERHAPLFGNLHLALLERYAPPSVVINENYDIVHLTGHAGQFLQLRGGAISANLLKLVNPELRVELRAALFRAGKDLQDVTIKALPIEVEGKKRLVDIHIRPTRADEDMQGFTLVLFALLPEETDERPHTPSGETLLTSQLEEENQHLKEQLSSTVEQYEASVEELKASNEELQAINEEMRSATEELETSKEELQSTNEELTTVNQELKSNVEELSRVNSDLQNLMASTEIGTIFLDRDLKIKRFTPSVRRIFNLIDSDVGRPLSDITSKLSYDGLTEDAEQVLRDMRLHEQEVRSQGHWFLARVLPYRALDDRIDGVVLTFVDITARKAAAENLRAIEERARLAIQAADMLAWDLDPAGETLCWSGDRQRLADMPTPGTLSALWKIVHPDDLPAVQAALLGALHSGGEFQFEFRVANHPPEAETWLYAVGAVMRDPAVSPDRVVGVMQNITARKRSELTLSQSRKQFSTLVENLPDVTFRLDRCLRFTYASPQAAHFFGRPADNMIGRTIREVGLPSNVCTALESLCSDSLAGGRDSRADYAIGGRHFRSRLIPETGPDSEIASLLGITEDITDAKRDEEERTRLIRDVAAMSERERLAQELHDTLAQAFTAVMLQLDAAEVGILASPEEAKAHLARAHETAARGLKDARHAVQSLRSVTLAPQGLPAAIKEIAARMSPGASASISCIVRGKSHGLPADVENELYRIAQEALVNAIRHASASHIEVRLSYARASVSLRISDDGAGFDPNASHDGWGLRGIRERVARIGAVVAINSEPGSGTEITVMLRRPGAGNRAG